MLVLITILTSLTTITASYAGGGNDDGGDGNKNKAEDESQAALADCDENDVEQAGFDCIAIAANDVEEESATLSVCKVEFEDELSPEDFTFTVTDNSPPPQVFVGDDSDGCVDVTIDPGEYAVSEETPPPEIDNTEIIDSDCVQDPNDRLRATGEIQAGESQICTFLNGRQN
jgi:hypothetical protein